MVQEALDAGEGAKEMLEEIGGDKLQRALTAGHALNSIRSPPVSLNPQLHPVSNRLPQP